MALRSAALNPGAVTMIGYLIHSKGNLGDVAIELVDMEYMQVALI